MARGPYRGGVEILVVMGLSAVFLGFGLGAAVNRWWFVAVLFALAVGLSYYRIDLDGANSSSTGAIGILVRLMAFAGSVLFALGAVLGVASRRLSARRPAAKDARRPEG